MKTSRKPTHAPAHCETKATTLPTREDAPLTIGQNEPAQQVAACGTGCGAGCSKTRVSAEEVRLAAYVKWESAGCPTGDGVQFWLEAEQELKPAV